MITEKKTMSRKRFCRVIYTKFKERVVDVNAPILLPKCSLFTSYYSDGTACYCNATKKKGHYRITFGGAMIADALGLPGSLDIIKARAKFDDTNKMFRAVYYHEIGHLKYTAMHCTLITDYKEAKYRGAIHKLHNILEDIVIERYCMSVRYAYTRKYFEFLESLLFTEDKAKDYRDNDDMISFFNFLLLKLRMKKKFIGSNKFASEHPEYLDYVKMVLTEADGVKRIEKTITFFEWLLSQGLKGPEDIEKPKDSPDFKDGEDTSSPMPGSGSAKAGSDVDEISRGSSKTSDAKKVDELEDTEKVGEGDDEAKDDEDEDSEDEGSGSDVDPDEDPSLLEDEVEESCVEALRSGDYGHEFYNIKEYFKVTSDTRRYIDSLMEKTSGISNAVATKIKSFKIRTRPRYIEGYSSGKLHVPSVIAGKPVNIFQRKEAKGMQTDLAIYLLLDNSGSMGELKSRVTTEAAIALTTACAKCNIPIAVSMFTADFDGIGATCYTYRMKTFKDKFDTSKYFLGTSDYKILNTYEYDKTFRCFAGNTDEINLFYVYQEYKKEPYRDKVLIIISDGATCGSADSLRKLAKEIEDEIFVIGIGACSTAPADIYARSKIFASTSELTGLADFMSEMLFNLSKGKKM